MKGRRQKAGTHRPLESGRRRSTPPTRCSVWRARGNMDCCDWILNRGRDRGVTPAADAVEKLVRDMKGGLR